MYIGFGKYAGFWQHKGGVLIGTGTNGTGEDDYPNQITIVNVGDFGSILKVSVRVQ